MGSPTVSQILNCNIYVDGTKELLGKASQVTLPDVSVATESLRGVGMIGSVEVPTGLEALVTKIKWMGWYADAVALGGNPFKSHKLQIRGNLQTFGAGGLEKEEPVVVYLTCHWKKAPLGSFAPGAKNETEDELPTTALRITVGGKDVLEIDILTSTWKVEGKDILADYRKNLGMKS